MKTKLLLLSCILSVSLQLVSQDRHQNIVFEHNKKDVFVNALLNVENYYVPTGDSLTITPYIKSGTNQVYLPHIVITEKNKKQISNNNNRIAYKTKVPYQSWMDNANLGITISLSRIGGDQLYSYTEALTNRITHIDKLEVNELRAENKVQSQTGIRPKATIQPQSKIGKNYTESIAIVESTQGNLKSKTFSIPLSRKNSMTVENHAAVQEIQNLVNQVKGNLVGIQITSYTSIDGIYYDNEQLTKKQAHKLKEHLQQRLSCPSSIYRIEWKGEDWDGLSKILDEEYIPYNFEIQQIIDNYGIFKGRERKMMELANGDPYRYLKKNVFPRLCRIECKITYK
ncbi:MAG: hypothetical protein E6767_16525 [Dysgonomonas sp.]|nr:hypothetical protein [Dysgonomonas sp.]